MYNIERLPVIIPIGQVLENEHQIIEFDVSSWLSEYPNGTIGILYERPDKVKYLVEVECGNNIAKWKVKAYDTEKFGNGQLQIVLSSNGTVAKSQIVKTFCNASIDTTGEIPEPSASWLEEILGASDEILETCADAKEDIETTATETKAEITAMGATVSSSVTSGLASINSAVTSAETSINNTKNAAETYIDNEVVIGTRKIASDTADATTAVNKVVTDGTASISDTARVARVELNVLKAECKTDIQNTTTTAKGELQTYVTQAQTSAGTATTKANAAATSATNAEASATRAETVTSAFESEVETIETTLTAKADKTSLDEVKEDLVELGNDTHSNQKYAKDISSEFNLNGYLNKSGVFVSNSGSRCTDFIKVNQGDTVYVCTVEDDINTAPLCIYNSAKEFVKVIENKGQSYVLARIEYEVEEDCYIRASSINFTAPCLLITSNVPNKIVFDSIQSNIGELETYYEDETNYVLEHGADDKFINADGIVADYTGGFVSDFIEVTEGDKIKGSSYVLYGNPTLLLFYSNKRLYTTYGKASGINNVSVTIPPMVKYIRIGSLVKNKGIEFSVQKNKSVVEMLNEKTTITYDIPNTHEQMVLENTTTGYLNKNGEVQSTSGWTTSDYIDLDNFDWFKLVSSYGYGGCAYVIFDSNKKVLTYEEYASGMKTYRNELNVEAIKEEYESAKYIRFCGNGVLFVYIRKHPHLIGQCAEESMNTGNVLYNKKIAFCGDSFTQANNLGSDYYDQYFGCYKSYGWRIADRNKMKLYHDGIGGSTMHIVNTESPNTNNPFAYQRYKNVPNDCDYIILQFGLNESTIANNESTKGTKDSTDTTTMWGSWNTVLEYLITNHPTTRIGVIMSDAWMPQTYFTALKEICEWWGIPLLDLGGDPNVPVMNGGRRANSGLTLNPVVAQLRNETFYTNPTTGDAHPNDAGHEWRSTVIEHWIRSL